MLWQKRIREKIIIFLLVITGIYVLIGCTQKTTATETATSSVIRQLIVESEEETVYLVSTTNLAVQEKKTVSGNSEEGLPAEVIKVFDQVNQARKDIGLSELAWSDELATAAGVRAEEIQKAFSHTRPDGSDWWTVEKDVVYGENLAKGYQSADSVMKAWLASTEHKDNILYSSFKTIGIAVYESGGQWYWVQEFGY